MDMTRDIKDAVSPLAHAWEQVKKECASKGLDIRLSCVARTQAEQCALYLRGRYPLGVLAVLYWEIFKQTLTNSTNMIVTQTIYSKHVVTESSPFSRALDFYLYKDGAAIWDVKADVNGDEKADYEQVAGMFEQRRLRSGKQWGDICHVEVK
jgi:hypothetical protein